MPVGSLHSWATHAVHGGPTVQLIMISYAPLKQWEHDDLSAPYWRWYWNDSPGAAVRIGREWIGLSPDRVMILPPRTPFGTRLDRPAGHLFCHFATSLQPLPAWRTAILHKPGRDELATLKCLASDLNGQGECPTHAVTLATLAMTSNLLARLPAEVWDVRPPDDGVSRALAILHEQPARTIANDELARMTAMSVNTLLRRFRVVTGTTPHQYVMQLRLASAVAALHTTDKSIDDIAAECGFCDRYHLSREFKRFVHASPAEFRRAAQRTHSTP
jgi:AraC-like DNA-binding protein